MLRRDFVCIDLFLRRLKINSLMKRFSLKIGEKNKISTLLMSDTVSKYVVNAYDKSNEKIKEIAKS